MDTSNLGRAGVTIPKKRPPLCAAVFRRRMVDEARCNSKTGAVDATVAVYRSLNCNQPSISEAR